MSHQAQTWVINHSRHKGSNLLVMLLIANHAHSDGSNAFPSLDTLAAEARMSVRQIARIIDKLEASQELKVMRSGGRYSHRYSLPGVALQQQEGERNSPRRSLKKHTYPNPDNMTRLNPDKMSTLSDTNPDNLSEITRTSPASNPDIAVSTEPREPSVEPKHTHRATRASSPHMGVSSGSKFTDEERQGYARAQIPPLGTGWLVKSEDGRYDKFIADWQAKQQTGDKSAVRNLKACPDCRGSTLKPAPDGKGVMKCRHERLEHERLEVAVNL